MVSKEKELYTSIIELDEKSYFSYFYVKRGLDIFFSFFLLVFAIPIILIFSILIKIDSSGPVFYFQERVGLKGKKIYIVKLRSMYTNAEEKGAQWALKNDDRITRVGIFIRKTRIDELPQLFSVIKGDMSLIGPRPERPIFHERFCSEIEGFEQRIEILPGLSGLAQVSGGYEMTPKEKLELDLKYILNFSLKQDMKIFLKTVRVILTGDGAR